MKRGEKGRGGEISPPRSFVKVGAYIIIAIVAINRSLVECSHRC